MKKISTLITAIAGIFGFIFLFSFSANAQEEEQGIKLSRFIVPALITPGSTVTVNIWFLRMLHSPFNGVKELPLLVRMEKESQRWSKG